MYPALELAQETTQSLAELANCSVLFSGFWLKIVGLGKYMLRGLTTVYWGFNFDQANSWTFCNW